MQDTTNLFSERQMDFGTVSQSNLSLEEPKSSTPSRKWRFDSVQRKVVIAVTFLAIAGVAVVILTLAIKATTEHPPGPPLDHLLYYNTVIDGQELSICDTNECIIAAADIIESMDTSVDPCQDFYSFGCGGWLKKNSIPESQPSWNQFAVLGEGLKLAMNSILSEPITESDAFAVAQVKKLYRGCMNETLLEEIGLNPLINFIEKYGGWPLIKENWNSSAFDLQFVLGDSQRLLGSGYLITFHVYPDHKNSTVNILYLDQATVTIPRSILVDVLRSNARIEAYKTTAKTIALILGSSLGIALNETLLDIDIDNIVDFEREIAAILTPTENRRDVENLYNLKTVDEVQELTDGSGISWLHLLNDIFSNTDITFSGDSTVVVLEVGYLQNVSNIIARTDKRTLSNYMIWRLILELGGETIEAIREASFKYAKVAEGVTAPKPRKDQCVKKVNDLLGHAVGIKYVKQHFSDKAKVKALNMLDDILASFKELLHLNRWMDDETKPFAIEKAEAMRPFIGYPDWYNTSDGLEKYYEGLPELNETKHFQNILLISTYWSNFLLSRLGKPTDKERWLTSPTVVNAFYMAEYNSISFPAGILQAPFYRDNCVQYLNYGAIGEVIGHEITHGFDDLGKHFDKNGNTLPWWTNYTIEAFDRTKQCIIDQYNSYEVDEVSGLTSNTTINGELTQGENIADNGGLRQAYRAYQRYVERLQKEEPRLPGLHRFTSSQMFFIANANIWCSMETPQSLLNTILTNPHSIGRYRANGPVSNMKEFAEAFNCPSKSEMNPKDKCIVW